MKRRIAIFCTIAIAAAMLIGCIQNAEPVNSQEDGEKQLNIVTTIFPGYDFAREVAGDYANLTMLLQPGAETHSYEPTPQDILTIQEADVFIYVGGESDVWVDDILKSMDTTEMTILSMMDMVEVVEEELKEGMEDNHGHDHGTSDFEDDEVEDRDLSDWAGDWQSVYPYLLDGSLDEVMEHKAEDSADDEEEETKTVEEYYEYYKTGYETDIDELVIENDTIEFIKEGKSAKADYQYKGYEILTYESGSKGVRYLFEAAEDVEGVPRYIQFSDHMIEPSESEHFHIYWGDDSFDALLDQLDNWPTYYPTAMSADDIVEEMLGHEEEDEEAEYDEHVWTSPANAMRITERITDNLCLIDEENAESYKENCESYLKELEKLDEDFKEVVADAKRKTLIFGDRFPFRYFIDEYGLDYYAAFSGCSTEADASAQTVAFLIDKVKEEEIPVVFHIELSSEQLTDTICESTEAEKMLFHSGHNVTKEEFENGNTYLEFMQ